MIKRKSIRHLKLQRNIPLLAWNAFFAELRLYYPVAVLAFQTVAGSFAEAMSVFAVMSISQALLEIPTGIFSDKIGRRMTLIVGAAAEVLGAICISLAMSVSWGLWLLYAAALSIGFANAMFSGNNDALVYETLLTFRRTQETSKMIGRVSSMGQTALAISGVLASYCLLSGMSYQNLMVLSLFPVAISFIFTLFIVEPPQHEIKEPQTLTHMKQALKLIVTNNRLRWLAIASAVKSGLGQTAHVFAPGFIESVWPSWMTPLYRTGQNGLGAIGFWFAGYVTRRFGLMKSLLGATIYSYGASFVAYITTTAFSPILMLTTQLSYAVGLTADSALKQENFSKAQRSTMGSIISFAGSLVGGIGSILAGVLADHLGPGDALLILLLITVPTAGIYFRLYKKERSNVR